MITDIHGRTINYLRLAVTDRCNLRCNYCMPHNGLQWTEQKELLSYDEMLRLCNILVNSGIEKIRITGGEPFVRKDLMPFLTELSQINGLKELSITTNGVLTAPYIPKLKDIGIRSINLSLDTLDRERFKTIARRDELDNVMNTLQLLLQHDISVKLNAVVMDGKNTEDIIPLAELTKDNDISVRFIEEMPFNGGQNESIVPAWDWVRILQKIETHYPNMHKQPDPPNSTSYNYQIPGHKGTIGIIAAYTRSFCGSCNRIRITPQGGLKTCLYDGGALDLKQLLRSGMRDAELIRILVVAIQNKYYDGWLAERARPAYKHQFESMAAIGG